MAVGDHIKVKRVGGVYYHHGVQVDHDRVIHYTFDPDSTPRKAQVCQDSIIDFADGGKIEIVQYASKLPVFEVMDRARSRLGEVDYNLYKNNCEHFASWCVTARSKSEQITRRTAETAATAGTGALTAATVGVVAGGGSVIGLSGPGIMSGLASVGSTVGAGAVGGVVVSAAAPVVVANVAMNMALPDDSMLPGNERKARKAGRTAAAVGSAAGVGGSVLAIAASGTTAGLSGPGIASGLSAIGGLAGGGMAAGTALTVAAPAILTGIAGYGVYKLFKKFGER